MAKQTKQDLIRKLDRLRRNPRSFKKDTPEFKERIQLEQRIDAHLYDKE